jgi:hypothetical protein
MKFKMSLKYRIRLTAQRHTIAVDLGKHESVQFCTYSAKKGVDAPEFSSNQAFEVGQKLSLRTPKGIRPTFNNELVHFDHVFKVSLELEREGRAYNAKFKDVMVEVQPQYVQESLPAFDEADSPPPPFTASTAPVTAAGVAIAPPSPPRSESRSPPPPFADGRASDLEDEELYQPIRRASWSPL